jgi:predicted enzyme related to lactoylglutathione lyase
MQVTAVAFVFYPVRDLARARRFYEEVLELTVARTSGDGRSRCIEYKIGAVTLALSADWPDLQPAPGGGVVTLTVRDLDAMLSRLRQHQIPLVVAPTAAFGGLIAAAADPDGNCVAFHQRTPDLSGPAIVHQ